MTTIWGLIQFPVPLICSRETLGQRFRVIMGGQVGFLNLPALPHWDEHETDPLKKVLVAPDQTKSWKRGEHSIDWGKPIMYPSGISRVERALLSFECPSDLPDIQLGNAIHEDFPRWIGLFGDYVELISGHILPASIIAERYHNALELFMFNKEGTYLPAHNGHATFTVIRPSVDCSMRPDQIEQICSLCSENRQPLLEYRILIEAYRAFKTGDYRKAILEASTAVEITLTNRITKEFTSRSIEFGNGLLRKFRMLSGRFELIKLLDIKTLLPQQDYQKFLIDPRNYVVHKANFPDRQTAKKAIDVSQELIKFFSPNMAEETHKVQ